MDDTKYKVQNYKITNILGCLYGDMPTTGASMTYKIIPKGLPGYEDYHAIQITYNMSSGIQDKRHPYPGSPYYAIGTDRVLYNVTPLLSW